MAFGASERAESWVCKNKVGKAAITPAHRYSPLPYSPAVRSWEGCKPGLCTKGKAENPETWKQGWELRTLLGSWEIAGSPLWKPILAQTVFTSFETLPSPAVMYWHVTKKHVVQDKRFWQHHMYIKFCTMWGFIVWLQGQKSSISHFSLMFLTYWDDKKNRNAANIIILIRK